VTVYDASTLQPLAEIGIPPKRGEWFPGNAANALSDDGRFMAVFNLTPATSVSIVDVKERAFTAEIGTPGCSLVYAAGPRRFLMLCANGGALSVGIDDAGHEARLERVEPFFDAQADPLTEKAVRRGNEWLFVSFEGVVHPVDVGGDALRVGETWSLVDAADRRANWRIGGAQHLAAQGRSRAARATTWLLAHTLPNPGIDRILVTQDEHPLLIASASIPPTVTVHDAMTGEFVRDVSEPGLAGSLLFAP